MSIGADKWGPERLALAVHLRDDVLPDDWVVFMENGTLLGSFRDGKQIPHDDDFDLAVVIDDPAEVGAMMATLSGRLRHPYKVRRVDTYADKFEVYDPHSGNYPLLGPGYGNADFHCVTVDLQLYLRQGTCLRCLYYREPNGDRTEGETYPLSVVLPPTTSPIDGEEFPAPAQVERFLVSRYGCLDRDAVLDRSTGKYLPSPTQ